MRVSGYYFWTLGQSAHASDTEASKATHSRVLQNFIGHPTIFDVINDHESIVKLRTFSRHLRAEAELLDGISSFRAN